MAGIGSSIASSTTTIVSSPRVKKITSFVIFLPNTEYSFTLPVDCYGYTIQARLKCFLKISHDVGQSGINYLTIHPCATLIENGYFNNTTLYIQANIGSVIIEIETLE